MKLPIDYTKLTWKEKRAVREQYIVEQEGLCFYCKEPLINDPLQTVLDKKINWKRFPKGFLNYPIHLQHDHHTLLTEGAVHAYCNAVLWQYHGK